MSPRRELPFQVNEQLSHEISNQGIHSFHATFTTRPKKPLYDKQYSDAVFNTRRRLGWPQEPIEDEHVDSFIQIVHATPELGEVSIDKKKIELRLGKDAFEAWATLRDQFREPLSDLIHAKFPQYVEITYIDQPPQSIDFSRQCPPSS